MRNHTAFHRGDTLIEVLFATAAFSLVAVSGISIMNQGTSTAQRSLEITLVRQEIDAQAETLRFLNASYIAAYQPGKIDYSSNPPANQWRSIQNNIKDVGAATPFEVTGTTCPDKPNGSFILNTKTAAFVSLQSNGIFRGGVSGLPFPTFAQVRYNNVNVGQIDSVDGIWIEGISLKTLPSATTGYIDFNIRACWDSLGQAAPVTMGTIVRLYEPR